MQLGTQEYTIHPLTAFEQFDLHRKVTPDVLLTLDGAENLGQQVAVISTFLNRLGKEDAQYVRDVSLSHVSRDDHKNRVITNGVLAYDDIGLFAVDALIAAVLKDSLGDFTKELATYLPGGPVQNAGAS